MTETPRLLFLAGYPRSGTTWFSNLINASPCVIYRHEFLGRLWKNLPEGLFDSLKYNYGLTPRERDEILRAILSAHYEADRPPFFRKGHLAINSPGAHQAAWMITKAFPMALSGLYRTLYKPRPGGQTLLLKETRSAVNMDSILAGLQPELCIFLFRHPCGALASQLRGIKNGNMAAPSRRQLDIFIAENEQRLADLKLDGIAATASNQSLETQLAIMWSVQNSAYLSFTENHTALLVDYDAFYSNRFDSVGPLLRRLGLERSEQLQSLLANSDSKPMPATMRDSSSEFYSVYRNGDFNAQKWRKELSVEQIAAIEAVAFPVYEQLQKRAWGL